MVKTRVARSKTGCQTCRYRKVRCDEGKPVCGACTRLELACSFGREPGTAGANSGRSAETSRYRVRFVSSPYSKRHPRGDAAGDTSRSQSPAKTSGTGNKEIRSKGAKPSSGTERQCIHPRPGVTSAHLNSHSQPQSLPLSPASVVSGLGQRDAPLQEEQARELGVIDTGEGETSPVHRVQESPGQIPVFFDLGMNFNFDLFGEEWLTSFPQMSTDSDPAEAALDAAGVHTSDASTTNTALSPHGTSVVIGPEDNGLIQHYLNVMTQYTKIRSSGDDNIYTHAFTNMALFYAPLYNVMMAWTALHLGQTRTDVELIQRAENRYSHAVSLLHQDQDVAHRFELSLVTLWFALQFELLAARGVDSFFQHLEFTADLVEAHRRHQKAGGIAAPLGPIGTRIVIWLGSYDARAAWIGGAGRLLQNLELFSAEYDFIRAAFPESQSGPDMSYLESCLRLSLELDSLDNRIAQLNNRRVAAPLVILRAVQADLLCLHQRLESLPAVSETLPDILTPTRRVHGKVSVGLFNNLVVLASCYCLFINFHRVLPTSTMEPLPNKNELLSAEGAATRILRIASWTCRLRPPSPQNIWPRILFLAGAETTDLIYQEWVVKTLSDAERWGVNFRKTRALLQHVIESQSHVGQRVDHVDAMKQSTGLFII